MVTADDSNSGQACKLVAVATTDPLDLGTFSGYSANLFQALDRDGVEIVPVISRVLKWHDALTGAVSPSVLLRQRNSGVSIIRPNWYWSSRAFRRFCRRFDSQLAAIGGEGVLLQVGTHVRTSHPGYRSFCVTDATVVQMAPSTRFSIGHASRRIVAEAIECQREVFFSCEKIFVLSQWAADSVIGDYGYPSNRVVVVGAGANLPERRPRRLTPEEPYVLFVGLDWERKGGPLLVEAFREVRSVYPKARLKIVGCSPPITEAGVDVLGYVDNRTEAGRVQLLDLYTGASCFCLLSDLDPFPNVLLEAGYMAVPVVSTDEGSRPELVENGRTGILVNRRDSGAIASAIISLLNDPLMAEAMGTAAQHLVEELYTWPVVSRHILREMGLDRTLKE